MSGLTSTHQNPMGVLFQRSASMELDSNGQSVLARNKNESGNRSAVVLVLGDIPTLCAAIRRACDDGPRDHLPQNRTRRVELLDRTDPQVHTGSLPEAATRPCGTAVICASVGVVFTKSSFWYLPVTSHPVHPVWLKRWIW